MSDASLLGAKVRQLRRRERLTQARMAEMLGVSASYLNLIENNRRPLTAPLLLKLAAAFQVELASFASGEDARMASDLLEIFGDRIFQGSGLTNQDVREIAVQSPAVGRAILTLYRSFQSTRENAQTLASRLSDSDEFGPLDGARLPSEEVNDIIHRHMNHFPMIEEAAERLWVDAQLDANELGRGLVRHLEREHKISVRVVRASSDPRVVRRFDPERRVLTLSDSLPPRTRNFQLAHQLGLLTQDAVIERILKDADLSTPDSRSLARVALANYFAGALLMPYAPFLEAARAERYDLELLGHRFRASFEQVAHRLTTMRRSGAEGVPFHFLRMDVAGNISKRFSGSGIRFARFSGACARWNIHTAFLTPAMIRVQLSRMTDNSVYFCIARTVRRDSGGYLSLHNVQAIGLGCRVEYARELVYSEGVDLANLDSATPVGVTCRLCERMDCEQRVFPSLQHPLHVDENVRGVSFYAPVID